MKNGMQREGFKTGISHANDLLIEGFLVGDPHIVYKEINGVDEISALNIVIESTRYTSHGEKTFKYSAVVFNNAKELLPYMIDGAFIKANGHLIAIGDYCRPVIDYPQIELPE